MTFKRGRKEVQMKKRLFVLISALVLGGLLAQAGAHMGSGPMMGQAMRGPGYGMGPGYAVQPRYCPYCGAYLGPQGYGQPMGPQMMGPRYWGYGRQPAEALKEKEAKALVEDALRATRNPNLKLGKFSDKGGYFEAEILTKDGSLVDKLMVDKYTGWMRSIY
ncbi:MAG: hypothetical protein DRG31_05080 [Deltaproteobacteria bacterium]|nr:MAG: hypothetical protein DRG31_05080 [Deltaproteobacteria bacterium]